MKFQETNEKCRVIWTFTQYEGDIVRDEAGQILNRKVAEFTKENLIVNAGKNLMLDRLFGLGGAVALSSVGVGTDSTAAAVAQTQLNPSVAGSVSIIAADAGTARSGQIVTMSATFGTAQANFVWVEAALFNGTTNGTSTMYNRLTFGAMTKTTATSIVVQIQVVQG